MLKATLESHDSNRMILGRSILDSDRRFIATKVRSSIEDLQLERPCASQEGASMLLRREGGFLRRAGGFVKKRGRVLKKVCLARGTGGGPLLQKGGGGFLRRGWVLKSPVEVLKEFDPLPPTLSVSP